VRHHEQRHRQAKEKQKTIEKDTRKINCGDAF
jgi:hypothetical protein